MVEVVGDVLVVEGCGVGVVAEGGGWFAVAEAALGLEELAFADQVGADAVTQAVQGGVGHTSSSAEAVEAV